MPDAYETLGARRDAWLKLAHLAEQEGDSARALQCLESAARLA